MECEDNLGKKAKIGDIVCCIYSYKFNYGKILNVTKGKNIKVKFICPISSVRYVKNKEFLILENRYNDVIKFALKN